MNNIKTTSNIGYEGFVNFKIYEKKKLRNNFTIHNAGQAGLFNFLATCLSGKLEAVNMPKYLSFSVGTDQNKQYTNKVQYAEIAVGSDEDKAKVTYTWIVPVTDFSSLSNATSSGAITVTLSSVEDDCATATISNSGVTAEAFTLLENIISTQSTNYVVVVAWQLTIGNIPKTPGENVNE